MDSFHPHRHRQRVLEASCVIHRAGAGRAARKNRNICWRLCAPVGEGMLRALSAFAGTRAYPWTLGGALALILSFLLTADGASPRGSFQAGDVGPKDIKAPEDMRVMDPIATNAKRQAAKGKVLPHYDIDAQPSKAVLDRLNGAFEAIQRTIDIELEKVKTERFVMRAKQRSATLFTESEAYREMYAAPSYVKAEEAFRKLMGGQIPGELSAWLRAERFAGWIREDRKSVV